jgi:fatty-acyl-CoA synthase
MAVTAGTTADKKRRVEPSVSTRTEQPLGLHPATLLEGVAGVIPDKPAVMHGDVTFTWHEHEERAARLAAVLAQAGINPAAKVAILLYNGPEWLEAHFAALKVRAVPINVNYRYRAEELRYLLDDADAEALIFHDSLSERLRPVISELPRLRALIRVADGGSVDVEAPEYEEALAAVEPLPPIDRYGDDLWMTYTGGTTGIPKGVMTKVGRVAPGLMQMGFGGLGAEVPTDLDAALDQVRSFHDAGLGIVSVIGPPLMHPTGLVYGAIVPHFAGGCAVTLTQRSYDPKVLLTEVQRRRATNVVIAGEVFCRPMVEELDEAARRGAPYDLSSLRSVFSSGMAWSAESKRRLLEHATGATLVDVVGSSEGAIGLSRATAGDVPPTGIFEPLASTKVIAPDGAEVQPGSGVAGMLAASGNIVGDGYFKDPAKSAKTYRVIDGERYAVAGDWATVEADGRIRFLGRESSCINTGGEKVYAEEVENVIKEIEGVADCLVFGVEDDRWGSVVTAMVSFSGATAGPAEIKAYVQQRLAGYKAPRLVALVDAVPRAPNGKADYNRAREMAKTAEPV